MLAILTTHPIQYQVPLWQMLARDGRIPFEVWYLTRHGTQPTRDREFGMTFAWDLDLLSGYPHRFIETPRGATPNSFWRCRSTESLDKMLQANSVKSLWIQGWQVAAYWQAVWSAGASEVEVWLRAESNALRPLPWPKHFMKRVLLGQFFAGVDRFLCIGAANRRLYESFGIPNERLYDAPYAVDNERFARQAAEVEKTRGEIRKAWGIPEDVFCVLICGKFITKKRPLDVVRAAEHLQKLPDLPRLHLLFVGSGELGETLRNCCNVMFDAERGEAPAESKFTGERPHLPRASFTGFLNQTEISRAYVSADCLVLPSDYQETWGLVVNEATASGLPCIISDHCGCAEDLGRCHLNSIYACGDVDALMKRIREASGGRRSPAPDAEALPTFDQTARIAAELYEQTSGRVLPRI